MLSRRAELVLARALREWPGVADVDVDQLLGAAEYHGLAGVIGDALVRAGLETDASYALRDVARDIDHSAHLATLCAIDRSLAEAGLHGVALKGALFAERYYPRPSARVTGDIDLLVNESHVEAAGAALRGAGYRPSDGPEEERFRRDHFHLHYVNPRALPLELHFHAYRGFGTVMMSEPLIERSVPFRDYRALRVLAPEDEVVYLATHAAAHRFGRWSWLFDLRLLIDALPEPVLDAARLRAEELGLEHPLTLAARMLGETLGLPSKRLTPLRDQRTLRSALAQRLLGNPTHAIARSAMRFAYTTTLCSDTSTSIRWMAHELLRQGRDFILRPL